MGCCNGNIILSPEVRYGVSEETPCEAITVDLLRLYKDKIDCYLKYKLWGNINSSQIELENAVMYLSGFISQKELDSSNCSGIENLWIVRQIVDKIVKFGACL